jgi:hypothetical protein
MKKIKRFQEGGYEDTDDYKNLTLAADREAVEYEGEKIAKPLREAAEAKKAKVETKAAKRIVTKEELAKSGFDNLRDFLNAERGLKRRDTMRTPAQEAADDAKIAAAMRKSDRSVAKAEGSFSDRQAYKRATQTAQAEEKRKAMGMKKGGMIGSASKRADGIAARGKTRGRMV